MRKRHKKGQNIGLRFMVFVLLAVLVISYTYTIAPNITDGQPEATVTPTPVIITPDSDSTIKLAAFNIQVFGVTKANKPEVMEVLSKIIRNYDIVAVQEIRDASQTALPALVNAVNAMGGSQYDYVVGERLGRTVSKEQYAYIYNNQTIELIGSPYTFPDPSDIFHREPYIANFKARDGNFDFVLITLHSDPNTATQEINDLPIVVNYTKSQFHDEGDFIILGDLNADCNYFKEDGPSPLMSDEYY
ncbi:MAG: endonuclease/exonuclease/phosphatase family protein [Candidatus Methanoperedens sp.]|nr:endonuclease/exonuclease/phosphatase family protein [Nitrospirota bacterium]